MSSNPPVEEVARGAATADPEINATSRSSRSHHRLASLDALRGIAAVSVMLLHFTTDFHRDFRPAQISAFSWGYGAYGVHLFFLISGFVILMTAEKCKRPTDFVVSRFSRLYPPYWAALIFTTLILLTLPTIGVLEPAHLLRRAFVNISMFQSWAGFGNVDTVYWTLQVEMSFYLVLLILIWSKAVPYSLTVMTGIVIVALVDHLFVSRPWSDPYSRIRQVLILEQAYLFTAGMVFYKMREGFRYRYLFILLLCAMCPAVANYPPNNPVQDTTVAVSLGLIVYLATSGRVNWIACRPLLYLGGISYSLYLTHHWLGQTFLYHADNWGMNPNVALVAGMVLCLVVATLMTYLVERPSLRWLRRRFSDRS